MGQSEPTTVTTGGVLQSVAILIFHLAFCNKINICKNRYVKKKTKKTLKYVKIQLVLTMEARIKK